MRKFTLILIWLCFFSNKTFLFSQRKISGQYVANIGAKHIDTSNIDLMHNIEIVSSDFKLKKHAIESENEFIILFRPLANSDRIHVLENAIEIIKSQKRLKFIVDFYQKNNAMPTIVDTLIINFELKGPPVGTFVIIDTIQSNPIKIISKCPKIDSIRFEQVNIVGNYLSNKSEITIVECDTIYYPFEVNIDPPDAIILIDGRKDSIHTKYVLSKNIKPSLNIVILKKGYKQHSEVVRNLQPNEIKKIFITLEPQPKDIWIFGSTALAYGAIWLYLQTKENAPKKIPSPPDFPK